MVARKTKVKAKANKIKRQVTGRCTVFCGDVECSQRNGGCMRARGFGK